MVIILIFFFIFYLLESFHDYYVIKSQEGNGAFNKQWHSVDFYSHILLAVFIAYLAKDFRFIVIAGAMRYVVFQHTLNLLRGKPFFYLSNRGVDGTLLDVFGKLAPYITFIIALFALVISILHA